MQLDLYMVLALFLLLVPATIVVLATVVALSPALADAHPNKVSRRDGYRVPQQLLVDLPAE